MEKKKTNDKRSSSAPCGVSRRTVRICFAVMTMVIVLSSMLVPASAQKLGTTENADVFYRTCLTGFIGFMFEDDLPDGQRPRTAEVPIGGIMPSLTETGAGVYANGIMNSFKPTTADGYYTRTAITRYKQNVTLYSSTGNAYTYTMDKYRHRFTNFISEQFTQIGSGESAQFGGCYITFDEYYFPYDGNNGNILDNLVNLRLTGYSSISKSYSVSVNLRFSYYHPNGQLAYGRFSRSFSAGNSNIASVLALDGFASYLKNNYPEVKSPLLISDFTIFLNSAQNDFSSNYIECELLGMQYSSGTPPYINISSPSVSFTESGNKLVTAEIESLHDEIQRLNKVISDAGMGGGAWNPINWVFEILGAFLGFEIMPGFSVGGVLGVCVVVCVMLIILKFYGGG